MSSGDLLSTATDPQLALPPGWLTGRGLRMWARSGHQQARRALLSGDLPSPDGLIGDVALWSERSVERGPRAVTALRAPRTVPDADGFTMLGRAAVATTLGIASVEGVTPRMRTAGLTCWRLDGRPLWRERDVRAWLKTSAAAQRRREKAEERLVSAVALRPHPHRLAHEMAVALDHGVSRGRVALLVGVDPSTVSRIVGR